MIAIAQTLAHPATSGNHRGMRICLIAMLSVAVLFSTAARAEDRHAGYYYPGVVSVETYGSRAELANDADRSLRLRFITGFTQEQLGRSYAPPYVLFAKGADAEKLLLVGTGADSFGTIFQARAILAQMTAIARGTPLFRDLQVEEVFTFLDLAKMMGFKQMTISDGESFAHQILIE